MNKINKSTKISKSTKSSSTQNIMETLMNSHFDESKKKKKIKKEIDIKKNGSFYKIYAERN
jgi:hypothetical protein